VLRHALEDLADPRVAPPKFCRISFANACPAGVRKEPGPRASHPRAYHHEEGRAGGGDPPRRVIPRVRAEPASERDHRERVRIAV